MDKTPNTKDMSNEDFKSEETLRTKEVAPKLESYFFPTEGMNIEAASLEEAVEKLNKIKEGKVN